MLQGFLPGVGYDTRLSIIGDRAFGFASAVHGCLGLWRPSLLAPGARLAEGCDRRGRCRPHLSAARSRLARLSQAILEWDVVVGDPGGRRQWRTVVEADGSNLCVGASRAPNRPHVEAVEITDVATWAFPFAPAKAEIQLNLIADIVVVQLIAAVPGELEDHQLRVTPAVARLDDELTFSEALGDLFGFVNRVKPAANFVSHEGDFREPA
jgi:hypothetical protein